MAKVTLRLTTAAPMLLYGAYGPELRSPSVRGILRYWARAILGAATNNTKEVWEREAEVFGSTGVGSKVTIRVSPMSRETEKVPLLPHRDSRQGSATAIAEEQKFTVSCSTPPGVPLPELLEKSLAVWLSLGGLGKRSRRMFGGVYLRKVQGDGSGALEKLAAPANWDIWVEAVKENLNSINVSNISAPGFPTLHPSHSWVMIGRRPYRDAEEANVELFHRLLRHADYRNHGEKLFGKAMRGRQASPLIAQVRRIGDDLYPVLTYMRTSKYPQSRDLATLNEFFDDAKRVLDAEVIWGNKFA